MFLNELYLEQFRNFTNRTIAFNNHTALIGRNGTGKSNIIEAIRLLSVGKSFKTSHLDEAIAFDQPYFQLRAKLTKHHSTKIELFYGSQFTESLRERRLTVDNQVINWLDFFGRLATVLFLPTDLEIVIGPPGARRRYLDSIFWQISPRFRQASLQLTKVLQERSALLWLIKTNQATTEELQPWNELLKQTTGEVRLARQQYLDFLSLTLSKLVSELQPQMIIKLIYQPNQATFEQVVNQEIKLARNLIGPQRDELEIIVNQRSARRFASRGQARLLVILLKVAEALFLTENLHYRPLILLDDMISELDYKNAQTLLSLFLTDYQVITTGTELNDLIAKWEVIKL